MSEINISPTFSGDSYNGYSDNLLPFKEEYLVIFTGFVSMSKLCLRLTSLITHSWS
jgi:hypothetical protein